MKKEKRDLDALVQVWIDRRYLATVQKCIVKYEEAPARHLSEVIRYAIEMFVDSAVEQGLIDFVDTTTEATRMLNKFQVNLNPRDRGLKNLNINLQRDAGIDDFSLPREADLDQLIHQELKKLVGKEVKDE